MGTLDGKVAIVTGASRGIGRAIAERLGRDGPARASRPQGELPVAFGFGGRKRADVALA